METSKLSLELDRIHSILKYMFVVIPIVAGADKFFNILVQWDSYLAPFTLKLLPFSGSTFMMIAGVVEIIAGFIVLFRTEIGAYIVSVWLFMIALSLLLTWHHPDVGVRDAAMAISAFILARLSAVYKNANPATNDVAESPKGN